MTHSAENPPRAGTRVDETAPKHLAPPHPKPLTKRPASGTFGRRAWAGRSRAVLLVAAGTVAAITSCSSSSPHPEKARPTSAVTAKFTASTKAPSKPHSARSNTVDSSSPTKPADVREVQRPCPYIEGQQLALIEGNRVGRVTVLTTDPVGCRFYFQYNPTDIVAQITVRTYATTVEAYNAMVLTAKGHSEVVPDPDIGAGAVAIKTRLQGTLTWQCTFAKANHVVTVHTRQPDPSFNARRLARVIAKRF